MKTINRVTCLVVRLYCVMVKKKKKKKKKAPGSHKIEPRMAQASLPSSVPKSLQQQQAPVRRLSGSGLEARIRTATLTLPKRLAC